MSSDDHPKLFGKYNELVNTVLGFVLSGVLGAAISLLVWQRQHQTEVKDDISAFRRDSLMGAADIRRDSLLRMEEIWRDSLMRAQEARRDSIKQEGEAREAIASRQHLARQADADRMHQDRQADIERSSQFRTSELARASTTFDEISRVLDHRLWASWRLLWAHSYALDSAEIAKRRLAYDEVLTEWNNSLNRNYAITERYFGPASRFHLEQVVAKRFACVHEMLWLRASDTTAAREMLNSLGPDIYNLNHRMLQAIQSGNVGALTTTHLQADVPRSRPPIEPRLCPETAKTASEQ